MSRIRISFVHSIKNCRLIACSGAFPVNASRIFRFGLWFRRRVQTWLFSRSKNILAKNSNMFKIAWKTAKRLGTAKFLSQNSLCFFRSKPRFDTQFGRRTSKLLKQELVQIWKSPALFRNGAAARALSRRPSVLEAALSFSKSSFNFSELLQLLLGLLLLLLNY